MVLPEIQFVKAGGYKLGYREAGEGSPLVFFHGMGGNSCNWTTQYEVFSKNYRVIGWDAPGYGKSDYWHDDLPSVGDYVLLAKDFMEALGIRAAHIVGHSFGGIIVTAFYRSFRERVLSLTLAEPVVGGGKLSLEDRRKIIRMRQKEFEKLGADDFAAVHVPRSCSPNAHINVIERGIQIAKLANPRGYLTQFCSLQHANIYEWTIRPRVPTMIIGGEHDATANQSMINDIGEKLEGAEKYIIPDIGHLIYLEFPERFNTLLQNFLERV